MIDFDEALELIRANVAALPSEVVPLADADGRVVAKDVIAKLPAPRSAVSAMDGYAVRNANVPEVGIELKVIGEAFPGQPFDGQLGVKETVRIFTGGPIPDGADRVIMQENIDRNGDIAVVAREFGPGWHVREKGGDFLEGALLVPNGTRLSPRAMIAAAAADEAELQVVKAPQVAIVGTGDELQPPGKAHEFADAIPESVSFGVASMVKVLGGNVVSRTRAADDLPSLQRLAGELLDQADLVIVTGGASVGERDFAKTMFEPHGLDLLFAKVAIKPGKPVWLGQARGKWVLGLPGNPTSAMVTARLFLTPLMQALQGETSRNEWQSFKLAENIKATGDRETFARAKLTPQGIEPVSNQDSGAQHALLEADWLIRCKANSQVMQEGDTVEALRF